MSPRGQFWPCKYSLIQTRALEASSGDAEWKLGKYAWCLGGGIQSGLEIKERSNTESS